MKHLSIALAPEALVAQQQIQEDQTYIKERGACSMYKLTGSSPKRP